MEYTIKNGEFSLSVKKLGAELCSFKKGEKEYIWQADPEVWEHHGPLLFPIVGRLKDDKIRYNSKEYTMDGHGFLKDVDFELKETGTNSLTLVKKFDEETLKIYPYKFEFFATYKIENEKLVGIYEIKNLGDEKMPFMFGLHNGFYCLEKGEDIGDVYLEFDKEITVKKPSRTEDSFMDFANRIDVVENSKKMYFDDSWYPTHAPVMDHINFDHFRLCHEKRGIIADYKFSDNFTWFNAWRFPNTEYICLEPWTGQYGVYPFYECPEDVEDMIYLASNESKVFSFEVKL